MKMDTSQPAAKTRRSDYGMYVDWRGDSTLTFAGISPNLLPITKHFMPLGSTRTTPLS